MSKPKVFEKPVGVKDYLPEAVAKLRMIEQNVLACMRSWGYQEIITPTLEYYDTVGVASSTMDSKLFKLLDKKGTTVVLRSDLTAPIARVVSSVLKDHSLPLRLSYHANVFRSIEEEAGRQSEFFQTGVELVGDASSEADAEIIALAIASLKAADIQQFKIALGHVGFLHGLFEEALVGEPDAQSELKEFLLQRNHVGYRQKINQLALPEQAKFELLQLLKLRGGRDICQQAKALSKSLAVHQAIDHLAGMMDVLEAYDVSQHVVIDLTMVGDFSYYTGMTFEGYAADLGFPVCSGGRYDHLLQQFGRSAAATGFSLKTNRILEVMEDSDIEKQRRMLILYDRKHRKEALQYAQQMRDSQGRSAGFMIETRLIASKQERDVIDRDGYEECIEYLEA